MRSILLRAPPDRRYIRKVMTARTLIKVGVAMPLLVAAVGLVFLAAVSQNPALRTLSHNAAGSAPWATVHIEDRTGSAKQGMPSSESQAAAPNSGNRPVTVVSGGPEDAGPDVVNKVQTPVNSNGCGPKPCRRP
jgi:hypothetical protein